MIREGLVSDTSGGNALEWATRIYASPAAMP